MRKSPFTTLSAALIVSILALGACDSAEERAESHYRRGLELLAAGDATRAQIEFRNALQEAQGHTAARLEYARALAAEGNLPDAIGQYLRVVETDATNGPAHLELAQLAIRTSDYNLAARHTQAAHELMPEDPVARAHMAGVEFRQGNRDAAIEMAEAVLAETPDSVPAQFVLIADRMAADDFANALTRTDAALAAAPADRDLHLARLTSLERLGDAEAVGAQLLHMVQLYPDDTQVPRALVQWHLAQGDTDGALAVLRDIAAKTPEDPAGYLGIVQFLFETAGPEAARAELQALVETQAEPAPFLRALAQLDFAQGRPEEAIASLRALTEGEESTPEIRDLQTALAGMLLQTGQAEEAAALVDTVLTADDRHVGALKLRARRYITEDLPEKALQDLETALTEAPRDPEVMTIMAAAHEREGAHDLAGQRLARAVEASDFGAEESLRYGRFLLADGRVGPAESTALDALRRAPENLDLLVLLGRVHIQRQDWTRARQVVATIRGIGGPAAQQAATRLDLATLQAEGRIDDIVSVMKELETGSQGNVQVMLGLAQAHLAAGDIEAAKAEAAKVVAADPDGEPGRLVQALIHGLEGEAGPAEALYREVIADFPQQRPAYLGLFSLLGSLGRTDEALATLEEGIAATGRDGTLLNTKASLLIAEGDFPEAIEVLEELYARNTANVVVANNLASLISTHLDDAESLDRAFRVARRLRGSTNPYFQDTYGWILTRRGDSVQALTYLEPAATALTEDPLTQYHLGMTYLALERWEEARTALARAVEIAGPESELPQVAAARERIAEIDARPPETSPPEPSPPEPSGG